MTDFSPFRFSTGDLPERERLPVWREVVSRNLLRVDIAPLPEAPFQVEATLRALPGLRMMSCTALALFMERTEEFAADNTGEFGLVVNLKGSAVVSQRGREFVLGVGDAAPISNLDPASLTLRETRHLGLQVPCAAPTSNLDPASLTLRGTQHLGLQVPYDALAPFVPNLEDTAAHLIPHDRGALPLLVRYLQIMQSELPLATPELRHLAVTHVHDLIALTLGATRDAADIAQNRGMRAARLAAIKADVIAQISNRNLSVTALAARHGVTPRSVQLLFEDEALTFSQFVLEQRLAAAHRMLGDPRRAGMSVSAIALAAGFGDLSHFNRSFRRRYGATPSDVRDASLGRD